MTNVFLIREVACEVFLENKDSLLARSKARDPLVRGAFAIFTMDRLSFRTKETFPLEHVKKITNEILEVEYEKVLRAEWKADPHNAALDDSDTIRYATSFALGREGDEDQRPYVSVHREYSNAKTHRWCIVTVDWNTGADWKNAEFTGDQEKALNIGYARLLALRP